MGYRSQVAYVIEFKEPFYGHSDKPEHSDQMERELNKQHAKNLFYTFIAESKAKQETTKAWDDEVKDSKYVSTGEQVKWGGALEVDYEQQLIKFKAEDVKWYDDYADVDCHNALIDLAEEYINGNQPSLSGDTKLDDPSLERDNSDYMSYTFVRIGEQSDDIENKSGGTHETNEYIYPVSTIQWNISEP
jgi:hypothetical protein